MIVTLDTLVIDQDVYDVIQNFAEDVGLNEVPDRDEMFFLLHEEEGVGENKSDHGSTTYMMDDITLESAPAASGDGTILVAAGYSPAIEEMYKELNDGEEPDALDIVISSNYDPELHDIQYLNAKLQDYFPILKFSEIRTRFETVEDVQDFILDGKSVDL